MNMSIQEYLAHFKGVTGGNNGQYYALCPAHDDRNPSLSIRDKGNNYQLKCHAGCKYPNIIAAAELKQESKGVWQHSGEYLYTPTLKKVRWILPDGSKKFVWAHRADETTSKWTNGAGKQAYPLYNQSALNEAKQGDVVFLAEGEKDVETLKAHGKISQ